MSTDYVISWKSKALSDETMTPYATSNNSLTPQIDYYGSKVRIKFTGSCLKQPKLSMALKKVVNIYIVYELGASASNNSDPISKNFLFGAVTLIKIKLLISWWWIWSKLLIFGVDMSSSAHIDTLVLGKGPTQGLQHTLTAEKCISLMYFDKKDILLKFALQWSK